MTGLQLANVVATSLMVVGMGLRVVTLRSGPRLAGVVASTAFVAFGTLSAAIQVPLFLLNTDAVVVFRLFAAASWLIVVAVLVADTIPSWRRLRRGES